MIEKYRLVARSIQKTLPIFVTGGIAQYYCYMTVIIMDNWPLR